jgi:hypothetical protein
MIHVGSKWRQCQLLWGAMTGKRRKLGERKYRSRPPQEREKRKRRVQSTNISRGRSLISSKYRTMFRVQRVDNPEAFGNKGGSMIHPQIDLTSHVSCRHRKNEVACDSILYLYSILLSYLVFIVQPLPYLQRHQWPSSPLHYLTTFQGAKLLRIQENPHFGTCIPAPK